MKAPVCRLLAGSSYQLFVWDRIEIYSQSMADLSSILLLMVGPVAANHCSNQQRVLLSDGDGTGEESSPKPFNFPLSVPSWSVSSLYTSVMNRYLKLKMWQTILLSGLDLYRSDC